jgi:anti-anti-sigma regulatory factor
MATAELKIQTRVDSGIVVVGLTGPLTGHAFENDLLTALSHPSITRYVLDLGGVTASDDDGRGTVLDVLTTVGTRFTEVALAAAPRAVADFLTELASNQQFPTVQEAVKAFEGS